MPSQQAFDLAFGAILAMAGVAVVAIGAGYCIIRRLIQSLDGMGSCILDLAEAIEGFDDDDDDDDDEELESLTPPPPPRRSFSRN
jgi:hypothetical protein